MKIKVRDLEGHITHSRSPGDSTWFENSNMHFVRELMRKNERLRYQLAQFILDVRIKRCQPEK